MRILIFLLLCFTFSLLPVKGFFKEKSMNFTKRISNKNYLFKNTTTIIGNNGDKICIFVRNSKDATRYVLHLFSVYTSSKAVYTNENKFVGLVKVDKMLYRTKPADSIFDVDFTDIEILGTEKHKKIYPFQTAHL